MKTIKQSIKFVKEKGKTVILNLAPAQDIPDELYKYIDIITPNETELEKITKCNDIKEGAKLLIDKGVKSVVVTLGDKGSYYTNGTEELNIDTIKVNAIDTTAA